jgi:selenocysteine lyase/cysteine desulfurase
MVALCISSILAFFLVNITLIKGFQLKIVEYLLTLKATLFIETNNMSTRRNFIMKASAIGSFSFLTAFQKQAFSFDTILSSKQQKSDDELITDESFWYQVKMAFTVSPTLINLNNGGVSPQPKVVQDAVERYNKLSNETPSFYMWRTLDDGREPLRKKLAELGGCSPDNIAIMRNSSEALENIIFGITLKPGDEVVLAKQDYPNMINAWKQREKRDGIVLKWVSLNLPTTDEAYLFHTYTHAFTPKTKVVHITHLINWCGQIIPTAKIATEARSKGILSIIDGAHSFAHVNYHIPDLAGDFYGTSLHKWLCAPFGSGLLYVKQDKISSLYPLMAAGDPLSSDIRKFENLGTRSFAIEQAIGQAIDFHFMIGSELKQKRLEFLKQYWCNKLMQIKGVSIHTPLDPAFSCAIANFKIANMDTHTISSELLSKFKVHTVSIVWENIDSVRVTPNVYTTIRDLDVFIQAVEKLAQSKS